MKMKDLLALGKQEQMSVKLKCSTETYDLICGTVAAPITEESIWDICELFIDDSVPFGLIERTDQARASNDGEQHVLPPRPQGRRNKAMQGLPDGSARKGSRV